MTRTRRDDSSLRESFIHIHVERIDDDIRAHRTIQDLEQSLSDVRRAVQDWRPMLGRVGEVIAELKSNPPPLPADEMAEAIQFLEWLIANNFTFLGVRDMSSPPDTGDIRRAVRYRPRLPARHDRAEPGRKLPMTPEMRAVLEEPRALFITKASVALAHASPRVHGLCRRQAL